MRIIRTAVIFLLLILPAAAFAGQDDQKYVELFYPDGMPTRAGINENAAPTVYAFYDEQDIPDTRLKLVMYSEEVVEAIPDHKFTVYIGFLEKTASGWTAGRSIDVTACNQNSADEKIPGVCQDMDGCLNYFNIEKGALAVHLYTSIRLSTAPREEGIADTIFLINTNDNRLTPVFDLNDIGEGEEEPSNTTSIFIADFDKDGATELLTRDYEEVEAGDEEPADEVSGGIRRRWADIVHLYKYSDGEERYIDAGVRSDMPVDAKELTCEE